MVKTFVATLKRMLEDSAGDWPVLTGLPRAEAQVIDADVSIITGAADKAPRPHRRKPKTRKKFPRCHPV